MTPAELQARAIEAADVVYCDVMKDFLENAPGSAKVAEARIKALNAAIAAYEANLWCDDMDAAPRDGTPIWAYDGNYYFECWFEFGAFVSSSAYTAGLVERDDIKRWRYPPAVSGEG